ncbi:polyprenyl synthetase family protein [Okibacterium endophyticum]
MSETGNLFDLVQSRIDEFLDSREPILARISPDLLPFCRFSRDFLSGGKRFRASFCYWGWNSVVAAAERRQSPQHIDAIVSVASALEVFHAAALVHDDIIDRSDTRRGAPSAHRMFERMHADGEWDGPPSDYGEASALLLGDLLLGWSDELLDEGLWAAADIRTARSTRLEFTKMRTEVTAGQYLDILEERAWRRHPDDTHLERAQRVITYKSAKYSIESPLVIGALLAGADDAQVSALRSYGLPLGIAFQLRDDILGVFGDAEVTGKPSGDDLREGKRTVLVAITRNGLPAPARRIFDELIGDPELDPDQVASLQATIRQSGAVARVEEQIAGYVREARDSLNGAPLASEAVNNLRELADAVTRRTY